MKKYIVQVFGKNLHVQVSGRPSKLSVIAMCPLKAEDVEAAKRAAIERVIATAKAQRPFRNLAVDPPAWEVLRCEEMDWDDSWSRQAPGLIWYDSSSVQSGRNS